MMVKAFAPGSISCIFSIVENKNPAKKGSLGAGFTVDKGVTVSIKKTKNKTIIFFNNKKTNFSTVLSVVKKLNKDNEALEIKIKTSLPIGCGFGVSGASALATAYSLNKLLKLKKNKKELAKIAHIAEVENSTGLGDVTNQYYGGFLVKFRPSSEFIVKRLPLKNKKLYYKIFSKLSTKKIIKNKKIKNQINKAGIESLKAIKKIILNKKTKKNILKEIIKISKEFSVKSELLKNKQIKNLIEKIEKNNGNASMIMLGNAVFSNKKFKGCTSIRISGKGARLL